ncbi:Elongator subunit elp2 [Coelomomyces lativittatus]|nr:Elongator subunit elp2 [Coelomomyces lativittatus]KAJ1509512.1 Elongator subunit elp2 [Coelomomyces lativittatus]KAJ1511260.1 Elongator subunit elp2 [Coelomomyces lativittatus]
MSSQRIQFTSAFLSSGASRQRHGSIWTSSGKFYYASCHQIVVCQLESTSQGSILVAKHTLVGHTKVVLCLTHFPSTSLVASSGADGDVRLWLDQECVQVLTGHKAPVHALACLKIDSNYYLASSDSLGQTCIWTRSNEEAPFSLYQSWTLKNQYSLCLAMAIQPGSKNPMLASGTTKALLHIYLENKQENKFEEALTLSGHEGWVYCLSFTTVTETSFQDCPENNLEVGDLLLASGGMDKYIRLWRFTTKNVFGNSIQNLSLNSSITHFQNFSSTKSGQMSTKAFVLHYPPSPPFYVFLDSVMFGHDDLINQVAWTPSGPLRLLSGSSDKSIFVWSFQENSWSTMARVGEQGGTEQIFYSVNWSPVQTNLFCATSYSGAVYIWGMKDKACQLIFSCTGHIAPVKKIIFDPTHQFLLTCSLDRTTRMFAPLTKLATWHEFSRIQIHGYDINTVAMLDSFTLCSGADEKVLRVFSMPTDTAKLLSTHGVPIDVTRACASLATLPALGLSNKATNDQEETIPAGLSLALPTESQLLRDTLWPEIEKLYGHPNEIIAATCSPSHIASTCKTNQNAMIRIHSRSWQLVQELAFHTLTVNALKFSPTSHRYLLSAGRDRSWALWKKRESGFQLFKSAEKCHARIIWDVDWDPDEQFFVTASRDKSIKVWELLENEVPCVYQLTLPEAVTSIAVNHIKADYFIAAGDELGCIHIFRSENDLKKWDLVHVISQQYGHTLAVNSICWGGTLTKGVYLASCSEDHSLRVYSVKVNFEEDSM